MRIPLKMLVYTHRNFILMLLFFAHGVVGCYGELLIENDAKEEIIVMSDPFCRIDPGDDTPNACTPELGLDFVGIKINGPKEIAIPANAMNSTKRLQLIIPLCGAYRFSFAYTVKLSSPEQHMSIIVVNNKIHQSYAGRMLDPNPILKDPNPVQLNMEDAENRFVGGFFNVNILEYVSFPLMAAEYDIYILLEEYKSNVVTIRLIDNGEQE